MAEKTLIVIAGPTAVGKTGISLRLARHFNTSIISADSRQCFKELGVCVTKPTSTELKEIPHYFINSHSILDNVDAKVFSDYALKASKEIFEERPIAILVGGTGLYIHSLLFGLDNVPEVSSEIREEVNTMYNNFGIEWLQREIKFKDPAFFRDGEIQNPRRLMRALEVYISTGRSILSFQNKKAQPLPFKVKAFHLKTERKQLYDKINRRVDEIMEMGHLREATELYPHRHLNALQTVGYREIFNHLQGNISLQDAVDQIKKNTRHYAKRQITWFKKWDVFREIEPSFEEIISAI